MSEASVRASGNDVDKIEQSDEQMVKGLLELGEICQKRLVEHFPEVELQRGGAR